MTNATISRSEKLKRACRRYRAAYVAKLLDIDPRHLAFVRTNIDKLVERIDRMPIEKES